MGRSRCPPARWWVAAPLPPTETGGRRPGRPALPGPRPAVIRRGPRSAPPAPPTPLRGPAPLPPAPPPSRLRRGGSRDRPRGNAPSPRRLLPRPRREPPPAAPCAGRGPVGPTWGPAVVSRPPAGTAGFPPPGPRLLGVRAGRGGPPPPGPAPARAPAPAPLAHGARPRPPAQVAQPLLSPPLWQDSCCATWTVERSASQVFIQLPPPKLPPSSPLRGRLMPGP